MGKKLELAIAALNGLVGDHLAQTDNGLATPMSFVHEGAPVEPSRATLERLLGGPPRRVVVLVHGLMSTESVWELEGGGDYGALLGCDLGFSPLYLRYNSGRPIADNGAELAELLERALAGLPEPVEELLLLGHSMGGLVIRAACHMGAVREHAWLRRVRRAVYVGTPHLGAPLERVGRVITELARAIPDPVARLVAEVAALRSEGIQDLGDADLRHEDRARRSASLGLRDAEHPVPLLASVRHLLVAGTVSTDPRVAALFGDALVPVPSATDRRLEPERDEAHCELRLLPGKDHLRLAHDAQVYEALRAWMEEPS